mmetsp:Transcript_39159/g.92137  ORF Transcript_39159/g.92137 Transcript_39159/m.92137 type:complete len:743 (+) Transcript_39159:99-2327(+)
MPPKAVQALAHELLSKARDEGGEDAAWKEIFEKLRKTPDAIFRPVQRKMSLLHQAAYWGNKSAVETLMTEFKADHAELDSEGRDAAGVAEAEGEQETAEFIRDLIAKAAEAAKPAPKRKAPGDVSEEDEQLAHKLLDQARDDGMKAAQWEEIFKTLREHPGALQRPSVRKYALLHQAAYWGKKDVVKALVEEFGADLQEKSADGYEHEAADIAEAEGHNDLAKLMRAMAKGAATTPGMVDDDDDEASALSPYAPDKVGNPKDALDASDKNAVEVWLVLNKSSEPKWEPYPANYNSIIANAKASSSSSASFAGKTLKFDACMEEDSAGKKRKTQAFKVLWEWDGGLGGKEAPEWRPYPPEAQFRLEAAMCAADAACEVEAGKNGKNKYLVDLVGLRQYSSEDSFRCRRVRRRGVALRVAFPPKVRDVKSDTWLDLTYQPDYWSAVKGGADANVARRFDLPADSPLIEKISEWMNSTIKTGHAAAYGQVPGGGGATKGMEVVRVEVVQHPSLWRRYCCYRGEMKSRSKEIKAHAGTDYLKKHPMAMPKCDWLDADINEAYFWHGSGKSPDGKVDLIDAIVSVGHEPSDENSAVMEVSDGASSRFAKNSSMFGSGVYLADIASKANLYVPCPRCFGGAYFRDPCTCSLKEVQGSEPYRMLLCRAVMGKVHIEKKYKDERYKGDFNPAKKLGVDSVMGEAVPGTLAFREYVVYNDSASYPEFIVHFWRHSKAYKAAAGVPKKKAKK